MDTPIIKIYNSLTKKKQVFNPLNPPDVNMYSCGVTVYDDCHIGHARSLYIFDVIRRYLKYRGLKVNFVRNITDIDDKIINRANELKVGWKELVNKYIDSYYEDLKSLGIEKGNFEPRATENIDEMKVFIQGLIDKGYAYVTESGVFFSVRKFKYYGKLSGRENVEQMLTGVRKDSDETKADPLDFALWKRSKPNEPSWESSWGPGRPGWHIECSVMSAKFLKTDSLDIHAGGRDLIFPHHENEIAQSEALTGKIFANYWIHHGLLTINSQKMAKSLGNFITIKDFIAQYKDVDWLKFFFLSAHYSQSIDFTPEKIEESRKQKNVFSDFINKPPNWKQVRSGTVRQFDVSKDKDKIDKICAKLIAAMDDDFNMPQALACLFELVDFGSSLISLENEKSYWEVKKRLEEFLDIFGIKIEPRLVDEEGWAKESERQKARERKDYDEADKIRREMKTKFKINPSDTSTGVTFTFDD